MREHSSEAVRVVAARPAMVRLSWTAAIPVLLLVALIAVRIPFLWSTLAGEEGSFAAAVLAPRALSTFSGDGLPHQFVGFLEGKPVLHTAEHPILPYWIIEWLGQRLTPPNALLLPHPFINLCSRLPFLVMFLAGCCGCLVVVAACVQGSRSAAAASWGVIAYALTTPLAIGASIQPQVDGSVGVMLLGAASAILVAAPSHERRGVYAFALAGVLAGLGKQEWTMAFAGAALSVMCLAAAGRRWWPRDTGASCKAIAALLLGLAGATLLSVGASPSDYLGGFAVMRRITAAAGGQFVAAGTQLHLLIPVLLLAVAAIVMASLRIRRIAAERTGLLVTTIAALAIIVGFVMSGWGGDGFPRYDAPALVMLMTACTAALCMRSQSRLEIPARIAVAVLCSAGVLVNMAILHDLYGKRISVTSLWGMPLDRIEDDYRRASALGRRGQAVVRAYPAVWLYDPDVNFISLDMDEDFVRREVRNKAPALADKVVRYDGQR